MISTSHVIGTYEVTITRDWARPSETVIEKPVRRILRLLVIPTLIVSGAIVLVDTQGCEQDEYIDQENADVSKIREGLD